MFIEPDGDILVASWLTNFNRAGVSDLARVRADGTIDRSFVPEFQGTYSGTAAGADTGPTIYSATFDSHGRILVAGTFSAVNGEARLGVARLNKDGSLDTSFNTGTLYNQYSQALQTWLVQPDGKILVAGDLRSIGSLSRLNPDGSRDTQFTAKVDWSTTAWGPAAIRYLALDWPDRIFIGGLFDMVSGVPRFGVAALYAKSIPSEPVPVNISYDGITAGFTLPKTAAQTSYVIESAPALNKTDWTLVRKIAGDGKAKVISDLPTSGPRGFFRIRPE
jgi:uncharacterized delta-60 repeat protein